MLCFSGSIILDVLLLEIYCYCCLGRFLDTIEQRCKKFGRNHHRKYAVIECVVLENVGKETGYDHLNAISGDSPCRMFATRTGAEVFSCYKHTSAVGGVIENKRFYRVVAFRNLAGIIWSVSIFSIGRGIQVDTIVWNFSFIVINL